MTSSEDFLAKSIQHQLGNLSGAVRTTGPQALDYAKSASSGMAIHWDHASKEPDPYNGWRLDGHILRKAGPRVNREKTAGALFEILELGAEYSLLVDMADHRSRSLISPDQEVAPVFSFNRPITKPTGRILWPLPTYHDIDGPEFLGGMDPDRVAWADKLDQCVWRGGPGNRGRLGKHGRGKSIRLLPLLQKFKNGLLSAEEAEVALMTMSRYRVVSRYFNDPRFDIGYTNSDGVVLSEEPFIDRWERPRVSREDCQVFKYILVLPGNDVASSFYWTMNSGSLGLVMDCEFETFATHHFRPWEHYVPFRRDLRDLERNLNWCEKNPDECQQMVARSREVCKYLLDCDMRKKILKRLVHLASPNL